MSLTEPPVAQYIRDHFSQDGLEVDGVGEDTVRVRMPPNFHNLTDLCAQLLDEHNAFVDFSIEESAGVTSVILEVYSDTTLHSLDKPPAPLPVRAGASHCLLTVAATALCGAAAAGLSYVLHTMPAATVVV